MKNVFKWAGMALAVVLVFSALATVALAQDPTATPQAHRYVDADGDGVCDNMVDEDGDGVCDLRGTQGRGAGRGMMNRSSNWADADGDGVCDNMVDEDGDGVCDLRGTEGRGQGAGCGAGTAPADGTGFRGGMRGGMRGRMQTPAGNSNTSFGGRWS